MSAITGIEGLEPTYLSIKHTKTIAIANKESIICGWSILQKELNKYKTNFIPVDSEHFSIWYGLKNNNDRVEKIYLTASGGPSTAWGSWQSASNPILRDIHEYILVYSKGEFGRKNSRSNKDDSISKDAFLENTKSIWKFPTASARKVGHPAPFPIELPKRLIELYSFENDIILDPFAGSGTTAIAAKTTNRNYIMIDINSDYCKLAKERINKL